MYSTLNYARITCDECGNKNVDVLQPGKKFTEIKKCPCQSIVKKLTKRVVKKKPAEAKKEEDA